MVTANPFVFYKKTVKAREREFLSKNEVEEIANKKFAIKRMEQLRDIFLFCCYTGLAYVDVQKLMRSEIRTGDDGQLWIFTSRGKNGNLSNIPSLEID